MVITDWACPFERRTIAWRCALTAEQARAIAAGETDDRVAALNAAAAAGEPGLVRMLPREGEHVVTSEYGRQSSPWAVERAMRAARGSVDGLPEGFRFHDLRHYYASLLIAAGLDVKVVQARMRHKNATTTLNTYGHLWPDKDETARSAVAAAMTNGRSESLLSPEGS